MDELKAKVEEALKATNAYDVYSVGMRNAFRYVIFLIDGKEPQYEDCKGDYAPKQVIRKQCKKEHDDGSIDYFAEWYCPHCNMLILRGFDNPSIKFCYKCGKPILWEGL